MKLVYLMAMMFILSACADMSMYNQVPAPIGRSGQAPIDPSKTIPPVAQTYPIEEPPIQEGMIAPDNQSAETDLRAQNPAVIALLDGAYQQSESGQLDLAASKLERAVRISPRDPRVWSALAKIRLQQKKYALAVSLAKKSNLLSGGDKNLQRNNWLLMAESYDNLGQTESARQARQRAERLF